MDEMSVRVPVPAPAPGAAPARGGAPRDLREWITRVEAVGQLRPITEPVSGNEEMGAITYLAHQEIGAPPSSSRTSRSRREGSAPSGTRSAPAFSRRTKVRRSVYESVAARWERLGFTGAPPTLWSLEE